MKKALLCVLLLGFLGASAFAQSTTPSLVWNGYANFGASIWNDGTNTNLTNLGSDSWTGGRLQLEGKYAASNYGWAIRLRDDGAGGWNNGGTLYFKRAWGWVTGLNGMLTLQAGRLGDYSWASNGWQNFGNQDGATGVQLQLMPAKGANVGVFVPVPIASTGTAYGFLPAGTGTGVAYYDTSTLPDGVYPLVIGAAYTMDMGYAALGYDLAKMQLWGGAGYTGMSNLTAKLELLMNNTTDKVAGGGDAANFFYLDEQVAYNMAPINVQLYAEEQFDNSAASNDMVLHFQPSVDYTMDTWNLGAFFSYLMDSSNSGYGLGVWAKASVAANATLALGGEYDLGDVVSATQNTSGNQKTLTDGVYDPLGGPYYGGGAGLQTQTDAQYRVYIDLVTKF